ncbi:MAG: AmmeMemoRadiSam system protein B [Candidatus Gracilibacteria bacterium]
MKKITIFSTVCLVIAVIALGGCGKNSSMKADVMDGMKAKNYYAPEEAVRGVVFGTNLKNSAEVAGFFRRLEKEQQYSTIVLLSAAKINGNEQALMGSSPYETPYGKVQPDLQLAEKFPQMVSNEHIKKEAWPEILSPYLAKSFPQVKFIPVIINENATSGDKENLAAWLDENLPADSLVIAQTVPKTSHDPVVAEFQLKFTKSVLENFDLTKLELLPLNNAATVEVLQRYLSKRKAQKMQNQFMDPATGNFISFSMDGPVYASRTVALVAFGDIMLDRLVRSQMNSHGLNYPFEKMDNAYLKSNDILVANLEGPVAKKKMQTSKSIAFRFNPDVVPVLQQNHFDALSEANNHAADMGWTGFNDTFELLGPTGIKVFGNPKEIENRSVATFEIQGQKIAFLGLEEVIYTIDDAKAVEKIKELSAQGYKVIPFLHWGVEYQHKPNNRQRDLAHKFIDAGAYAVIGAHPHVVQTYETYHGHPIFYSLGNAIFDQYFSKDTQEGLSVAMLMSDDQIEIFFLPIKIDRSQFRLAGTEERTEFLKRFADYGEYGSEEERQNILAGKITLVLTK